MTDSQWTELQALLRKYKRAESAVDKLAAKLEATKRIRDGLAEQIRDAMPKGE
jgi:uncharacterized protein YaaN involved in tellurite resistance